MTGNETDNENNPQEYWYGFLFVGENKKIIREIEKKENWGKKDHDQNREWKSEWLKSLKNGKLNIDRVRFWYYEKPENVVLSESISSCYSDFRDSL